MSWSKPTPTPKTTIDRTVLGTKTKKEALASFFDGCAALLDDTVDHSRGRIEINVSVTPGVKRCIGCIRRVCSIRGIIE